MKAGEVVFQRLLDGKIQYVVPLYQRPYSWGEKQWEQLWADIVEIYRLPEPRNHFIGSVVTQQAATSPEGASKYLLIDGQQRMTTLFILLSMIRDHAEQEAYPNLADEIHHSCLVNQYLTGPDRTKFVPTQGDRDAFHAVVVETEPNREPNGRVRRAEIDDARKYFSKQVFGERNGGDPFDLRKLYHCIVNHLDMVSIHLDAQDSPNRIFESLNNTGLPLSVADLIRNYFLMSISDVDTQQREYDNYWRPMEQLFPGEQIPTTFFWNYLMMDGSLPRQDDTYDEIKDRFKPLTPEESVDRLRDFHKFSRHYVKISGPKSHDAADPKAIQKLLLTPESLDGELGLAMRCWRLKQWDVVVADPFLMGAMDRVEKGEIVLRDLVEVVGLIESFVVRRTICGVSTHSMRRIFAQMVEQIDWQDVVGSVRGHLLSNNWPTDEEFLSKMLQYRLYNKQRLSRTRLVLWTIECWRGHNETPALTDDITIEHIMPQTLSAEWERDLGANATEVYEQWLDTIGNLTLSGYNPTLSNKPFAEKQPILADSNFALNTAMRDKRAWGEVEIQRRGEGLAEEAALIWQR